MALSGHSRHRNNLSVIGLTADIGPGSPAPMTLGNMRENGVRTLAAWWSRLPRIDGDLNCGIRPEPIAVTSMMLCVPVSNASPHLAKKVEVARLGQVSEIA